ncbi:hypothetical protein P389DRAFT_191528 [Cystobasidium minutum MCA 4210]|uniref:uncharacterized protein n=1 Tax=Cystobasidium minutum MCA 4210 TaxID=1397322 RepID=UPI0034CF979A|eukprot:jgi/Rhomi1/191528/estExt_fgenesh1_pg.C_90077
MKSPIANFALSLVLLSTSATFTTAIPAPLPAATGYASGSKDALEAEAARAQLRPVWRPGPRLDAGDSASAPTASAGSNLSVRGPIFRRNAESKFQYRRRASAGLAVAGNIAYGLEERDVAGPFGINQHVPLPVAMRVRREVSLLERDDDDEEEDYDCSEYDDDEDEEEEEGEEQWSAPASSSSSASEEEKSSSSSSAPAPAPSSSAPTDDASSNQNSNPANPLLSNNVAGTKKDDSDSESDSEAQPESQPTPSSSSSEDLTPTLSSEAAWIAPAPESTSSSSVYVPESTKKSSAKKTKSKSKSKSAAPPTQTLPTTLTTPSDIAPGTFTVEQGCTRYHTVVAGEVCLGLLDWSKDLNLTLEQLYQYNPAIDSECLNLQIGWGVCIGANPVSASSSAASSSTPTSSNLARKRANQ